MRNIRTTDTINRGELNFMRSKKTKSSHSAINCEPKKDNNLSKKGSDKFFKFQQMSNLILNKVDDILNQYPSSGNVINNLPDYSDSYNTTKSIISKLESNTQIVETNSCRRTRTKKHSQKLSKENQEEVKNEEISENSDSILNKKDTFITGVLVESQRKDINHDTNYLEENNKKIKEVLDNVNDIENYIKSEEYSTDISPEHQQDMKDFRNMMMEVDGYKRSMQDEFDELQYLIKFVDNTKSKVNRHMFGVSNVFTQTKLKTVHSNKLRENEENSGSDGENNEDEILYNKEKNLSKIKDKLFNIQDNVITYHHNFLTRMTKVEKKNSKYKNIIYEDGKDKLNIKYDGIIQDKVKDVKKKSSSANK